MCYSAIGSSLVQGQECAIGLYIRCVRDGGAQNGATIDVLDVLPWRDSFSITRFSINALSFLNN